jgi:hypothetical protein
MGETTNQVRHPQDQTVGHDLDPNVDGDLVRHVRVAHAQALVIAVSSQDSQNLSVSVRWIDSETNDNLFTSESATDLALSGVQDDHARLYRKGPVCEVTVTSDASAGTQNRVNCWLDTHR